MKNAPDLVADLESPVLSFRLAALDHCFRFGNSPELLQALERRQSRETDPECQALLAHAIRRVHDRLKPRRESPREMVTFDPATVVSWPAADKLAVLADFTTSQKTACQAAVAQWLREEKDPLVATEIIRQFSAVWPEEYFSLVTSFLFSPSLSPRIAALEGLVQHHPQMLAAHLPRLLLHEDPRIQSLAVRGLAAVDLEEALTYVDFILTEMEAPQKLAALKMCVFLPYEAVRPGLLRFFAGEQDLGLLEQAGLIFRNNPDPDAPYRLWEIAEQSGPEKAALIKSIVQGACQNLRDSGIIREEFPEFLAGLKAWIKERAARRFVQEWLQVFSNPSAEAEGEWQQRLEIRCREPEIRKVVREALTWPVSDGVKQHLRALLSRFSEDSPPPVSSAVPPERVSVPEDFFVLPEEEKIRRLATWRDDGRAEFVAAATNLAQDRTCSEALHAAILRAAQRLGTPIVQALGREGLKSSHPTLLAAAIEYEAQHDIDHFRPQLGHFLKHPHPRVKAAILKVLKSHDPRQALSTLKALLGQRDPQQQRAGLACLVHFDFSQVRPVLLDFLHRTTDPDILSLGLCYFTANEDPEDLFSLFQLGQNPAIPFPDLIREAEKHLEEALLRNGRLTPPALARLQAGFSQRYAAEQQKRKNPPGYALRKIRETPVRSSARVGLGAAALLLCLFGLFSLFSMGNRKGLDLPLPKAGESSSIQARPHTITGKVLARRSDLGVLRVETPEGIWDLKAPLGRLDWLKPGDLVTASVVETGKTGEGIEAELRSLHLGPPRKP